MVSALEDILVNGNLGALLPYELREAQRQKDAEDDKFWKNFLYFFELTFPAKATGAERYGGAEIVSMLFPLVMNPQVITMSEPFTVTTTPTVYGGLFVEENGVIARQLHIEGTTGFFPKPLLGKNIPATDLIVTESFSFERRGFHTPLSLSGQKHFQFLQDRVFRTYGELKRDPVLAEDTRLAFHNVKDDEHWHVIPLRFDLRRTLQERVTYRYSFDLLVVDKATSIGELSLSEDKSWLDKLKETVSEVRNAIQLAKAVINEMTATLDELERSIKGVIGIVNDAVSVINSAADFVNGVADFIAAPLTAVANVVQNIDSTLERMANLPASFRDTVVNSWRKLGDAFDQLGIHKDAFVVDTQTTATAVLGKQIVGGYPSSAALSAAEDSPPTRLRQFGKLGSGPMAGDRIRASVDGQSVISRAFQFRSMSSYIIRETDTLPSIAARLLGDARLWRTIAIANNLRAPYISRSGTPGTVLPGARLSIPSVAAPVKARPNAGVVGTSPVSTLEDQVLGVDLRIELVDGTRDQYDLVLEGGSTPKDIKLIRGIENLKQAIRTRITTEQGTNVLYRRLGFKSLIGIGSRDVDDEVVRLRFREAIGSDPRIARVSSVYLNPNTSPDVLDVEVDAIVRGLNQPVALTASTSV